MGTFRKPEIDKKDFVSSKLFDDLMSGKYPERFYEYRLDYIHPGNYVIFVIGGKHADTNPGEVNADAYIYNRQQDRDDDALQLRLMSCPLFEECSNPF